MTQTPDPMRRLLTLLLAGAFVGLRPGLARADDEDDGSGGDDDNSGSGDDDDDSGDDDDSDDDSDDSGSDGGDDDGGSDGGGSDDSGGDDGGDDDDNDDRDDDDRDDDRDDDSRGGGGQRDARVRNVTVRYSDGWVEQIVNGRYVLIDNLNRQVIDRQATYEDFVRMVSLG